MAAASIRLDGSRGRAIMGLIVATPLAALTVALTITALVGNWLAERGSFSLLLLAGAALLMVIYSIHFLRLASAPGWLEISAAGLERNRFGHTQYWAWSDLESPTRLSAGRGGPLVGMRVKATGKMISIAPSFYNSSFQELTDIIISARGGQLVSRSEWRAQDEAEQSDFQRSLRQPRKAVVVWICFWVLIIGGTEVLLAASAVRDSHIRADLARRGIAVMAQMGERSCGKFHDPAVRFEPKDKAKRSECLREPFPLQLKYAHPAVTQIGIVYDPRDPSYAYYAPAGQLPQHDVTGIWPETLRISLLMLALAIPPTLLITCWKLRKDDGPARQVMAASSATSPQHWLQVRTLPLWLASYGVLIWSVWPVPKYYGIVARALGLVVAYAILRIGYKCLGIALPDTSAHSAEQRRTH